MKLIIASDIHGSAKYCKQIINAFLREGADRLVLLGDILYHGPRNPLPEGYSPAEVYEMLNAMSDKIIAVRGNCDCEVDQMVLNFNVSSDYSEMFLDGICIKLSHGHRPLPNMNPGDVYVTGHTHVALNADEGFIHLNPGSVSLPKDGKRGYILYEDRTFLFKTLDGKIYDKRKIII